MQHFRHPRPCVGVHTLLLPQLRCVPSLQVALPLAKVALMHTWSAHSELYTDIQTV